MNNFNENILPPPLVDIIKNMNMAETQMARENYYHRLLAIRDAVNISIMSYEKAMNRTIRK